jgi:hypothetical protein
MSAGLTVQRGVGFENRSPVAATPSSTALTNDRESSLGFEEFDANLKAVIAAWPTLPEAVKSAFVAMAKASAR